MKKSIIIFFFAISFLSCEKKKVEVPVKASVLTYDSIDNYELAKIMNYKLENKIILSKLIDSLISSHNVKVIDSIFYNESTIKNTNLKSILHHYTFKTRKYSLKVVEIDEDTSNSFFYDGKTVIDFSKHKVLSNNNTEYQTTDFGFNDKNELQDIQIIEVADQQFLCASVTFPCNGTGCGCNLSFIYNVKDKKAFFTDNYRFAGGMYPSDFNNDGIVDLFIVGRTKNPIIEGLPLFKESYQLTWFEYKNKDFKMKIYNEKPYNFKVTRYLAAGGYPDYDAYYSLKIN